MSSRSALVAGLRAARTSRGPAPDGSGRYCGSSPVTGSLTGPGSAVQPARSRTTTRTVTNGSSAAASRRPQNSQQAALSQRRKLWSSPSPPRSSRPSCGVLVGRRNDGKPPWTFIAGEVEPGETPADAAVREVKEETALARQRGEVIGERVHPRTGRTMIYLAARAGPTAPRSSSATRTSSPRSAGSPSPRPTSSWPSTACSSPCTSTWRQR